MAIGAQQTKPRAQQVEDTQDLMIQNGTNGINNATKNV